MSEDNEFKCECGKSSNEREFRYHILHCNKIKKMLEKTDYSIFSELKKHYSIKGLNIIKCFLENYIKLINVQIKKIKKQEDAINDFIRPLDNNNDYNKLHYQNKPRINLNENN